MNPSTHKKVAVRHQQLGLVAGIVDPAQLGRPGVPQPFELLTPEGQATLLDPRQVQAVYFISDFDRAQALRGLPAAGHGSAARLPGLWVRVRCRDRYSVEGIVASELLDLEAGLWLSPLVPDSPWQRVYLPRSAMEQIVPMELVRRPRRRRASAQPSPQFGLFTEDASPETAPGAAKERG
ncbi:MAG: DUF6982 domain-containing protein [Terriglobales bacterium]